MPYITRSTTIGDKELISHNGGGGHTPPGSTNPVQKDENRPHPRSSSVQRFLQHLAVDDAGVRSPLPVCSPTVAAAVAADRLYHLACDPLGHRHNERVRSCFPSSWRRDTMSRTVAVVSTATGVAAASGVAAAVAAVAAITLVTTAVAAAPLAAVAAATSRLAVAATAAAVVGTVAVHPPWRTVSGLARFHHIDDQGVGFPIPMWCRRLLTVAAPAPAAETEPEAAVVPLASLQLLLLLTTPLVEPLVLHHNHHLLFLRALLFHNHHLLFQHLRWCAGRRRWRRPRRWRPYLQYLLLLLHSVAFPHQHHFQIIITMLIHCHLLPMLLLTFVLLFYCYCSSQAVIAMKTPRSSCCLTLNPKRFCWPFVP